MNCLKISILLSTFIWKSKFLSLISILSIFFLNYDTNSNYSNRYNSSRCRKRFREVIFNKVDFVSSCKNLSNVNFNINFQMNALFFKLNSILEKVKKFLVFRSRIFKETFVVVSTISIVVFIFKTFAIIFILFNAIIVLALTKGQIIWILMTMISIIMNVFFNEFMSSTSIIVQILMLLIVLILKIYVENETTSIVLILFFISITFSIFINNTFVDATIWTFIEINNFEIENIVSTNS